eukprot:CAMPEP_0183309260 /NCGR_PEP_ID=MMETSP0160_2-20130417/24700_1 /TAXON_ID=2839 ORGANISM="Odontella Sinensis, Strain Grunow 1884" /NCGR_SAMPLE_ID=MMETSP0160_2 /ASSEMBLY_ACC=CAM_ASM_000250 /LENGTH=152 /DNA_ID=CAMNT_0025473259 /DNA_START=26 /DNA_END=484 /DNA_ORIENTATION=+
MTLSEEEYADASDSNLLRLIKASKWDDVRSSLRMDAGKVESMTPDAFGNLPLHAAIGFRAPDDIIMALMNLHPDATRTHGTEDWLPLHVAAMWGSSAKVMEALIREYPQALDDEGKGGIKGRTPRHFASRFLWNKELLERPTSDWLGVIGDK